MSDFLKYKRIMVKISGEGLMGPDKGGVNKETVKSIALDIQSVLSMNIQVCIVIGGGNIFRGVSAASEGMDRVSADYMGMLATVINALALQNALENVGVSTRVQSAIAMNAICEPYIRRRAERHLTKGRVVIFAAGTGNPFFTTDTAAALRAAEMSCDVLLKATQVDGVYSSDPKSDPSAVRYDKLSFDKVLSKNLKIIDTSAIALAREKNMPIIVFDMHEESSLANVLRNKKKYTFIGDID
mgnify:FL=1